MPQIFYDWTHRNYVCLLVTEAESVVSVHKISAVLLLSRQIITNEMDTIGPVHVTKFVM